MVLYDKDGNVTFEPRVGCWASMLSLKWGYLKWLQKFKLKLFHFLMVDKGLLKFLYAKKFGEEILVNEFGKENVSEIGIEGFDVPYVLGFLEQRPCFFDNILEQL